MDGYVELTETLERVDDTLSLLTELPVVTEVLELTAATLIKNRARRFDTVRARLFDVEETAKPYCLFVFVTTISAVSPGNAFGTNNV